MSRLISALAAGALALAAASALWEAKADAVQVSHGLSAFGDLKYPPGFSHFDYVNPAAPKGGAIATTSVLANQTFDTLNAYTLRGDAPMGLAAPYNFVYDTLMTSAGDEPDAVYGLLASHAEYIPGGDWIIFELRPEARFADGSPVTAEDVAFSLKALKSDGADPRFRLSLVGLAGAEALAQRRVRVDFAEGAARRDLPMQAAGLPVFSKAWFEGRDFGEPTMEQPLGSGPYEVEQAEPGRAIVYRRRDDYWARDLPVNVGRWNFDEIRIEYYRDRSVIPQEIAAGNIDLHESFSSRAWATEFEFPAVRDGRVIKELIADDSPMSTQGFWINMRRDKFSDPRTRQALAMAFDFEWSNRALFYDLYVRTTSFFQNTAMEAEGAPGAAELALLEPFRDSLPPEVFGEPYTPPVTDGSGRNRRIMREASRLLEAAGWTQGPDGLLRDANGQTLSVELVNSSPAFERVINPYVENLRSLGVDASFRIIDQAQEQRRQKEFDYDLIVANLPGYPTPGNSLRNTYLSSSADQQGSYNLSGVADPAVDALVEAIIAAEDRESLTTAARALDRVLRSRHIWVANWHRPFHPTAWWDLFGRPETKPVFARGILDLWWRDPARTRTGEQ
ncbi:extracellular solute-binding protein [Rubrimonas cliftonensis]|uniref:Microcin C transport system substrate-binding protein n=1 Tax=Rubrimonas cliftonensis TaxID=89524 RepID=A0A1H4FMC0_9RHOB|nr:extracellular solute-binding protein [Rubrimonas cliftonensis]SEA98415.1 microcin C transport system substrate-binding protein [Rubrimonas cliftonensis]